MPSTNSRGNYERAIRAALKMRHLRHFKEREDILMIDELGLAHAQGRIDLAVFNGHLHGYEIKSAGDSLERLSRQLALYRVSLQKLTLVVATRHLDAASGMVPDWCGIVEVIEGPRGGMTFAARRRALTNPDLDPFMFAHLLWRSEAQELLRTQVGSLSNVKASRKDLYKALVAELPVRELAPAIKAAMACRTGWRDQLQPS